MTEERRITIGSLQIQRRVILSPGADDIALTVEIDSTAHADDIKDLMDTISAVADRERAKVMLGQREKALEAAQSQPRQIEREIAQLTARRHAFIATARAVHDRSGKQAGFKLSEKQISDVEKYDAEIEAQRQNKTRAAAEVPLVEWEIASLKARIAGVEPPPRPVDLFDAAIADLGQVATA